MPCNIIGLILSRKSVEQKQEKGGVFYFINIDFFWGRGEINAKTGFFWGLYLFLTKQGGGC